MVQRQKGQSKVANASEYNAPGTSYCVMPPPSGTGAGDEAIKKPKLN